MKPKSVAKRLVAGFREYRSNWVRALRVIWAASPWLTTCWAILLVLQGIIPGVLVYLTKYLVDGVLGAIQTGATPEAIGVAVTAVIVTGSVVVLGELLQPAMELLRGFQADLIQDHVKHLIHSKAAAIDIAHYESPDYHDRLEQAASDGASRPLGLLESFGATFQQVISILFVGGILFQYSWWLPLVLVLSTLPAFLIVFRFDRQFHKWWRSSTSERRWISYYDTMLTTAYTAPEVKIFNLNPRFQSFFQKLRQNLRRQRFIRQRRLTLAKLAGGLFSLAILGAALGLMGWRAFSGYLTAGDLALFYQAFNRGQSLVQTLFNNLGQIVKNSMYLTALFEYLDLGRMVPETASPAPFPDKLQQGIYVDHITFAYPGTEKKIFENFSLHIPAGKTVAIVGENGSGKTTLFKLLCRFFDPQRGSVLYDGSDVRSFSTRDLLDSISIMFQFPLTFNATVREIIGYGDARTPPTDEAIQAAAEAAGADEFIRDLPDQYDTMLGRSYASGVEISGGQWQRLALARAYFRSHSPVILLDEPTSFLDSWAEANWFRNFRRLAAGKVSVVITHRFTIAMRADLIVVLDRGRILETGTHEELIAAGGHYAKSWFDQVQASEPV